ncbi:MAG TPA: TIR domain-containing protein [Acidimicrobiales bacterium]|nr:TIR domain-containing protein [Acidimicrobiales bacterium]
MATRTRTPVFISFDYDHDARLKDLLVGQARNDDSPFFIEDWSIKKETKSWKADAKRRIGRSKLVLVLCGHHTDSAVGVAAEIEIARQLGVRFILLRGYRKGKVERPAGTSWFFDTMHDWTWDNLQRLTDVRPWWQKIW